MFLCKMVVNCCRNETNHGKGEETVKTFPPESYVSEHLLLRLVYLASLVSWDFWWHYVFHYLEKSLD